MSEDTSGVVRSVHRGLHLQVVCSLLCFRTKWRENAAVLAPSNLERNDLANCCADAEASHRDWRVLGGALLALARGNLTAMPEMKPLL